MPAIRGHQQVPESESRGADPPEVTQLRLAARRWLEEAEIPSQVDDATERFEILREWQHRLYEAGWMGLHWPEKYGGGGLTALHHLAFYEELASFRAPPPVGLIGLDVVGPTLAAYGSPEQKERYLRPILTGEDIWCQGFSEPGAGSDLAGIATTATPVTDGFVINGQKVWTSWAHKATWCALLARTGDTKERHRGISYLLVDMSHEGVIARPLRQMTGDEEFCEVFFDDVLVPADALVGELHGGWGPAMHTLAQERSIYTVRRRLEIQVEFDTATMSLNGAGIHEEDQAGVEAILGGAVVALAVLEAQTRKTVERIEAGEVSPHDSLDKLLLTSTEKDVFRRLSALIGGYGLQSELSPWGLDSSRIMHGFLYSQASSIYGGTSEIQRNIVAQRLLGLPR